MRNKVPIIVLSILLAISMALNIVLVLRIQKDTASIDDDVLSSQESETVNVDNSEYEDLKRIIVYVNADLSSIRYFGNPEVYDCYYSMAISENGETMNFSCVESGKPGVSANYSIEVFNEIKEMLYRNQIEPYYFSTDSNGKVIEGVEPYYIQLDYGRNLIYENGMYTDIVTPSNIDEIMSKLNELKQSAEN